MGSEILELNWKAHAERCIVCVCMYALCSVCGAVLVYVCEFHTPDGKCVETKMGKTKTACDAMLNILCVDAKRFE